MTIIQVSMTKSDNAAMEIILKHAANFQGSLEIEPFYDAVTDNPDGSPDYWWIEYTYRGVVISYNRLTLSRVLNALATNLQSHWNKVHGETNT